MIISQLSCPSCGINFSDNIFYRQEKKTIQLDKIYYYDYFQLLCTKCKQQICILDCDKTTLWKKKDQYTYYNFVKNKKNTKFLNKKFLYLYHPCNCDVVIDGLCKYIDFNKFDAIITTERFSKKIKNIDKQLCVIPQYLYQHLDGTLIPNFFVQKIIIRNSQKFEKPILYSTYNTFFNHFQLLYKQKNWFFVKKYLK